MLTAQQWEPPALNPGCREQLHPTAPTASALLRQEPHFLLPCVFFFPPSFKAPFKKLQFFFDIVLISVISSFGAKPSFVPTDSLSFTHRQGEGTASTQPSSPCLVLNFAGRSDCWRAPSVTKGHQGWGAAAWAPTASPYSSQTQQAGWAAANLLYQLQIPALPEQPPAVPAAAQGCSAFPNCTGVD